VDRRPAVRLVAWLATVAVLTACSTPPADPSPIASEPMHSTAPAVTAAPSASASPWVPPEHLVGVDGGRFIGPDGGTFTPRGTNYFLIVPTPEGGLQDRFLSPAVFDRDRVAADFAALADSGFNTVRLFLDSCSTGPDCIGDVDGSGLNPAFLDVIAETMSLARDAGLHLLLTSNDLPDEGGYWAISDRGNGPHFPGYRNTEYLTEAGHEAAAQYWADLLDGLLEREAAFDAVLGWSILNEQWLFGDQPPLSLASGEVTTATGTYEMSNADARRAMVVDNVRAFIERVATVIREKDPTALVTMGFFAPKFPHPTDTGGTWYVDTAPLMEESALDFLDFHAYPGGDIGFPEIGENFGVTDAKPVIMGEVGAFTDRYGSAEAAGVAVQRWIADSCAAGFDGWLYWGYLRAPAAIGDSTWSLTDDDGYLLRELSPDAQADPCTPTLADPNIAAGQPVSASSFLPGEPPANAVDGGAAQWGSGSDAPQWLEVDLGSASTVTGVELAVAQFPAGLTLHVVEARLADGSLHEVHRFEGATAEGEVLEVSFDPALTSVVAVRVTTLSSPSWVSWREIRVLGSRP
jgi:hypothetical protein